MKLFALLFPFALLASQDERQTLKVVVPDSFTFEVELPKAWDAKISQPRAEFPPTIRATPPNRAPLSLQMTFIPIKPGKLTTSDEIKDTVRKANARYADGSVEKKAELLPIESKTGEGYYCTFTDSSLANVVPIPEGKYLKVSSGAFVIERTIVTFTILYNPSASDHQKTAVEAIGRTKKAETK